MMMKNQSKLILSFALFIMFQCSLAYNSNNRLVDTYDTLTIFDENDNKIDEWKLTSFPYIDGVSKYKF